MRDVQVMMLAAGLGTRLWPLTADRGKPAVPFRGRPLIRGMLDWLHRHGARHVVVNTHHQADSIRAALADPPQGMSVSFSHEDAILGTAGALARARGLGLLAPERSTLVVNAKLVTTIDLGAAWRAHAAAGATVTMVLRSNLRREAFTTVRTAGDRVAGFGPDRVPEGERPLAFTGIHFLEPPVLARAEERFSDTVRDLYPPEIAAGRALAHVDDAGEWTEASTLDRYLDLQLEGLAGLGLVDPTARVDPSAHVERSVLGPGARIESGAVVQGSVLWSGAVVGAGARIMGCVLGERAVVAPGARLDGVVGVLPALAESPPAGFAPAWVGEGLAFVPIERRDAGSSS